MAIKRNKNGKWSIKESDKYITYKRVTDLIKEDAEVLKKYDLRQAKYIYVGQCGESEIDDRHSKFRYDVLNKGNGNKNITFNIENAIIYRNIIRFFIEQKQMSQKEVENYLFRSEDCFIITDNGLTKEESEAKEETLYHSYLAESGMTDRIVLLKNRDSQLFEKDNSIKLKNSKKQVNFNAPSMELIYRDNKFYIKFNDDEYEMQNLELVPIIQNDTIDNNDRNLDKKNTFSLETEGI